MKVICGLGNPGPEYDRTRHNVGWWAVDRISAEWRLGPFRRERRALSARGRVGDADVLLLKPLTFMNRSGAALAPLVHAQDVDPATDLLLVVDDAALEPGRLRLRASGSAGGHNGLKSVEAALRSRDYARLRIGVGGPPPGHELSDWVLSPFDDAEDEDRVLAVVDEVPDLVRVWLEQGVEAAASRHNR